MTRVKKHHDTQNTGTESPVSLPMDIGKALKSVYLLLPLLRRHKRRMILIVVMAMVGVGPKLVIPKLLQTVTDKAYPTRDYALLGWLALAFVGLGLVASGTKLLISYHKTYVVNRLRHFLSMKLFTAFHNLPLHEVKQEKSGSLVERAVRDVDEVSRMLVEGPKSGAVICFTFIMALTLMMMLSWWVAAALLIIIPGIFVMRVKLARRLRQLGKRSREIDQSLTSCLTDSVEGSIIYRLFRRRLFSMFNVPALLKRRVKVHFGLWRASAKWGQIIEITMGLWSTLLIFGGWHLVFAGYLSLGQAIALGMYIGIMLKPFQDLSSLYQSIMEMSVSAERIHLIFNRSLMKPVREGQRLKKAIQSIQLRDVTVHYPGREVPALQNINLKFLAGETVVVVGPNGSGKSSLLRVVAGLETRVSGKILVNGVDRDSITQKDYLSRVSHTSQRLHCIEASVWNNLGVYRGEIRVEKMARHLGVWNLLSQLPDHLDTVLGSGGVIMSAGELQKLALLRATCKSNDIMLLDEVTAYWDADSGGKLLERVVEMRAGRKLTILCAHDMAIAAKPWVTRVIVLKGGRVVEDGSPVSLIRSGGVYAK